MNPVVHFEMPAKDKQRVMKFYTDAFGWKMNMMGQEMGEYIVAETGPTADGRPTQPGTINGGFFGWKDEPGFTTPSIVISVEDIASALALVKKAGGSVVTEPMDIPGIGTYAAILDSEGNRVGVLQPAPMM